MICKNCQRAADQPPLTFETETLRRFIHPTDCGCDCQHKPTRGSADDIATYVAQPVKEGQITK